MCFIIFMIIFVAFPEFGTVSILSVSEVLAALRRDRLYGNVLSMLFCGYSNAGEKCSHFQELFSVCRVAMTWNFFWTLFGAQPWLNFASLFLFFFLFPFGVLPSLHENILSFSLYVLHSSDKTSFP